MRYDWTRLAFLSYSARGLNAIECANFKENERMHREVRGAAECF